MAERDEPPVVHLLAQWHEIPADMAAAVWNETIAAFKQAMAEFCLPEHPDGRCPSPDCQCSPLEALVTARAYELLGWQDAGSGDDDR